MNDGIAFHKLKGATLTNNWVTTHLPTYLFRRFAKMTLNKSGMITVLQNQLFFHFVSRLTNDASPQESNNAFSSYCVPLPPIYYLLVLVAAYTRSGLNRHHQSVDYLSDVGTPGSTALCELRRDFHQVLSPSSVAERGCRSSLNVVAVTPE